MIGARLSVPLQWSPILSQSLRELNNTTRVLDRFIQTYGEHNIYPKPPLVYRAFQRLMPDDVKGILLAQSPYNTKSKLSGVDYACGKCFDIPESIVDKPLSYEIVEKNILKSTMSIPGNRLSFFEDMGFLMLNVSLTIGDIKNEYIDDHRYLWESLIRNILKSLTPRGIVVVLFGSVAGEMSTSIDEASKVIRYAHPAARDSRDTFYGCKLIDDIYKSAGDLCLFSVARYIERNLYGLKQLV